jgi:transcriptional regulator with XRE-family HTH domain
MDPKAEIKDFLTSRRARITPDDVGLTTYGTRQVSGLRREEVATLAGVSVDYYNRMERGNLAGVSEGVLDVVADALRLDEAERTHLHDLARASTELASGRRRSPVKRGIRPSIQWIIDSMTGAAALAVNGRQDILAANHLGKAFFAPMFDSPAPANMARFTYLDPRAREFFADWNRSARECIAALRMQVGRNPFDRELSELVGELSTRSAEFATIWGTHNVRLHRNVEKRFNHPIVGQLSLQYDRLEVAGETGIEIFAYVAEPGSTAQQAFNLLANWAMDGSQLRRDASIDTEA